MSTNWFCKTCGWFPDESWVGKKPTGWVPHKCKTSKGNNTFMKFINRLRLAWLTFKHHDKLYFKQGVLISLEFNYTLDSINMTRTLDKVTGILAVKNNETKRLVVFPL
jgi:hypothetical protein